MHRIFIVICDVYSNTYCTCLHISSLGLVHCLSLSYPLWQHCIILFTGGLGNCMWEKRGFYACTLLQAYSRGFVFIHAHVHFFFIFSLHVCGHMWVSGICLLRLRVTFVDFVCAAATLCPPALMTHISYLQSLPNPSSASSGTDYCFQTPKERRVVKGGGWRGKEMPQWYNIQANRGGHRVHVNVHTYVCTFTYRWLT